MSNFFGLIGEKLGHSFSPQIHNLILEKTNSEACYNLFEVEESNLKTAVLGLKALGCLGTNVTIPYKVKVMEYLHSISTEAEKIGAINTISFKQGELKGFNTDYIGFGDTLNKFDIQINKKSAVILGTGGASKAVVQYLIDHNISEVVFVSRTPDKTADFKDFNIIDYDATKNMSDKDLIINCTPCGMYPNINDCPTEPSIMNKFSAAVDLIYNPFETLFLKQAKAANIKAVNGLYMLVAQAAASHEIWRDITLEADLVDVIYNKLMIKQLGDTNEK